LYGVQDLTLKIIQKIVAVRLQQVKYFSFVCMYSYPISFLTSDGVTHVRWNPSKHIHTSDIFLFELLFPKQNDISQPQTFLSFYSNCRSIM